VAALVKAGWALEYLRLSVTEGVPWDWLRGVAWICLALIVLLASAWPEPARELPPPDGLIRRPVTGTDGSTGTGA
jgi:hypothetical protein